MSEDKTPYAAGDGPGVASSLVAELERREKHYREHGPGTHGDTTDHAIADIWLEAADMARPHEARWHAERDRLRAELAALAAFKAFVHMRLDTAGVPTHPDGPHSKEGCRIGDRLDLILTELAEARQVIRDLLATGLNGGNNVRLAYLAAKQNVLSEDELAKAELSEQATQRAYALLAATADDAREGK